MKQRWVEAIDKLMRDRSADVPCPKCQVSYLDVRDSGGYRELGVLLIDRFLSCRACGARKVIQRVKA
jgi:hypothetical protein